MTVKTHLGKQFRLRNTRFASILDSYTNCSSLDVSMEMRFPHCGWSAERYGLERRNSEMKITVITGNNLTSSDS